MMTALKIAATGMHAQQTNVDVLSNNISNLNTTGFKRQRPAFNDLIYLNQTAIGAQTSTTGTVAPTGVQIGLGVNIGSVYKIMQQGTFIKTDNPLDLAVQGRGFFKIDLPDGTTGYTRDGSFQVNSSGQVVTKDGYTVEPAIVIPTGTTDVSISADGEVSGKVNDVVTVFGQLTVSMFINEAGLENIGDNYYKETDASGTASDVTPKTEGSGGILQSHLEGSNVDPIESITDLITAQRAYELNSRVITTVDEMLSAANQIR